jgi:four helix bundle protein
MEKFKKLRVWEKAHLLVLEIYKITEFFPKKEIFSLTSQMRRAAISVVANIVEGTKRKTIKDQQHFYVMSNASLEELKYYIFLSRELMYITKTDEEALTIKTREIGGMLYMLHQSMNRSGHITYDL